MSGPQGKTNVVYFYINGGGDLLNIDYSYMYAVLRATVQKSANKETYDCVGSLAPLVRSRGS